MADDLTARAYRLLARRAYTRRDLARKLAAHGTPGEVARVLAALAEAGYLDDVAFAREYVRLRLDGGAAGPLMLRHKLREKGVPDPVAARVVEEMIPRESEDEAAGALARKKRAALAGLPGDKIRRRVYEFLLRRGFSPEIARKHAGGEEAE